MTSIWYGEVKVQDIKPDLTQNLTAVLHKGRDTMYLNDWKMWKSLSAIVRSVKWLSVSYTAAVLLPITFGALGRGS